MRYKLRTGLEVIYRPFERSDARKCADIHLRNFRPLKSVMGEEEWEELIGSVYRPENLPRIAQERDYRVVATVNGEVLGTIGFIPDGRIGEISNLSVDKDFQGRGLGKLLVSLAILQKIPEGIGGFYAYVGRQSKPIFQKLGFVERHDRKIILGRTHFVPLFTSASEELMGRVRRLLGEVTEVRKNENET